MANYFVMGGDRQEYGPVPPDELQKWVAEGRVDALTQVRAESSTEWQPVSAVPELAAMLKKKAPVAPVVPGASVAPESGKTSGLAIASLVFGILGLLTCGLSAIFGLLFGIVGMVKISNSRGALRGHGLALAGTIVSGVFLFMLPVLMAMLLPALAAAKAKAEGINCMNNEKQLSVAIRMYSDSHTNQYPAAAHWCDDIMGDVGNEKVFTCPAASSASRCAYAFNDKLDGIDGTKVNPQTVVLFEADGGWNAHGGRDQATALRHQHKAMNVAFADGHVERVPESRLDSLRWDP
jgi:prepilin-type processing-associated H-X9-DG protein